MAGRFDSPRDRRAKAVAQIYAVLRAGGVEQLNAAALLYNIGVSVDEISIAARAYGDNT